MHITDPLISTMHEWFGVFQRSLMDNFFVSARDNGLTMAQFGAILRLFHKGACAVSDIGNDLGVTNSAASQMLERMVQLKLITRSEDPNDRRVKQIVLTEKGRQIMLESSRAFHKWMEDLAQSLNTEEQDQVKRGLEILIDKSHELGKKPI